MGYTVLEEEFSNKEVRDSLIELIESVVEDLEEFYDSLERGEVDVVEWINENTYSVFDCYKGKLAVCFAYGGPGLWINENGEGIAKDWGANYIEFRVTGKAWEAIREIFLTLEEIYTDFTIASARAKCESVWMRK